LTKSGDSAQPSRDGARSRAARPLRAQERSTPEGRDEAAPLIVAITGASGAPYAVRLLELLASAHRRISLIVSAHGRRLLQTEMDIDSLDDLRDRIGASTWDATVTAYDDADRGAPPASGSAPSAGMVICPCSLGTVAAVAAGTSRSLIERAADVTLKERRRLILVPRETPLSIIHLENMLRVSRAGAVVLPAAPGFYHRPTDVAALVDFVVARILDHCGVPQTVVPRWSGKPADGAGTASRSRGRHTGRVD
jgi:4-hydroxy-3-polyprenylbenzoate decarboxylase